MPEVIGPGRVFIGTPDGNWTDLGTVDAAAIEFTPQVPEINEGTLADAYSRLTEATATLTVSTTGFIAAMDWASWWLHNFDKACYPRKHRRCHVCHPAWSRPLAVDGREYHRRQLARQRRKRRA